MKTGLRRWSEFLGIAVYGVVKSSEAKEAQAKTQAFLDGNVGGNVFVAKANNRGAIIRVYKN